MKLAGSARGLAALAALLAASGTAAAEPSFAIALHFTPSERSSMLVRAMTDEASAIWAPYGVQFVWSTDQTDGRDADESAHVVDGSFDVIIQKRRPRRFADAGRTVLGLTRLPGHSIDHAP